MRELEGKPLKEKTEKDVSTQIRILRNKKTGETVVVDADGNVLERRNAQGGEIIREKIKHSSTGAGSDNQNCKKSY